MMSGLIIGMLFRKVTAFLVLPFMLWMPMAATVPSRVETAAAMTAMRSVFFTAASSEALPCICPVRRFRYKLGEKPSQLPSTLLSVKENTAMNTSGAYRITSSTQIYSFAKNFFIRSALLQLLPCPAP